MTKIQGVEAPNLESLDFVKVLDDKVELLEEFDEVIKSEENLTFKNLLYTLMAVSIISALFILKIAVANQVYKKSISIYKLERELEFLKVQKNNIVAKLQSKRYKLEILDELQQ